MQGSGKAPLPHDRGIGQDKLVKSSKGWVRKLVGAPEPWNPLNSNSGNTLLKHNPLESPCRFQAIVSITNITTKVMES